MSLGDHSSLSLNPCAASPSAYCGIVLLKQQLKHSQDEIPPCVSASTLIYWRGVLFLQPWPSVMDCKAIAEAMVYIAYNSQHFFHIPGTCLWNHVQCD